MEEEDDNFLDGVIEFGDGRQYKIDNAEPQDISTSAAYGDGSDLKGLPTVPVAKEDRFVDDFDRSWPKSKDSPVSASRDVPPASAHSASPSVSPVISHAAQSPLDSSRVLFNERSNRLEPYSQTHRPGPAQFGGKRSNYHEANGEPPRGPRDGPHNIQVLQKPPADFSRNRRFSGGNGGFAPPASNGYVGGHRDNRRDGPPPSPRMRDLPPHAVEGNFHDKGRRTSMGPPPVPSHALQKDGGSRQLPPHLSQVSPRNGPRRLPSGESRMPLSEPPLSAGLTSGNSTRMPPPHSPALSHASLSMLSPIAGPNATLPLSAPELDEARKDVMQTAAARAKARRQQEEEEREAQKERARRKAAELEEKMKAAEAEKQKQKDADEAAKTAKVNLLSMDVNVLLTFLFRRKKLSPSSKMPSRASKYHQLLSQCNGNPVNHLSSGHLSWTHQLHLPTPLDREHLVGQAHYLDYHLPLFLLQRRQNRGELGQTLFNRQWFNQSLLQRHPNISKLALRPQPPS